MTNKEMLIAVLNDEIDDCGASREAWVHYHIGCPYSAADRRCRCYPAYFRFGKTDRVSFRETKEISRELCVSCKEKWLESEVDE